MAIATAHTLPGRPRDVSVPGIALDSAATTKDPRRSASRNPDCLTRRGEIATATDARTTCADNLRRRQRKHLRGAALLLAAIALSGCSRPAHLPASTTPRPAVNASPDLRTAAALVLISQVFNDDYDRNNDGPVWDRWDARSRAVISRGEYIRRHAECATAPQGPARVEDATPGPNGAWLVHYEIGGQQLTDYWFYVGKRWAFDLVLSNPDAARLYRLPFAKYAAKIGCQAH